MDDSNSDWDSLPHEEQGKKNSKILINEFYTGIPRFTLLMWGNK